MKCQKCGTEYFAFKGIIDRNKNILSLLSICPNCMSVKNTDILIVDHFEFRDDEFNDGNKTKKRKKEIKANVIDFSRYYDNN